MITIGHEEKTVVVKIALTIAHTIKLEFGRTSEMDAVLLANQIQNDLGIQLREIRREAYEKGWKDKSSHKTKQGHFHGSIYTTTC